MVPPAFYSDCKLMIVRQTRGSSPHDFARLECKFKSSATPHSPPLHIILAIPCAPFPPASRPPPAVALRAGCHFEMTERRQRLCHLLNIFMVPKRSLLNKYTANGEWGRGECKPVAKKEKHLFALIIPRFAYQSSSSSQANSITHPHQPASQPDDDGEPNRDLQRTTLHAAPPSH